MKLTDTHIALLRALVDRARETNSDVGMDVNVLAALLDDWQALKQDNASLRKANEGVQRRLMELLR